jgi:hypothetical protein
MKVTSKLSRFNFDVKAFLDAIDEKKQNFLPLSKLFAELAEKFSIYFSVQEQITIRNAIFPGSG